MSGQKEISVGVKFTGDDSGFQRVVKDINAGIGDFSKGLGKGMAAGVGFNQMLELAKKAWEGYKTVMNSTEGTAEKLDQQIGALEGSMSGLMRTIATGDWVDLINNITNTATATRDLTAATQELEHLAAGNTIKRGELMLGLSEARVSNAEATDPNEKKKYLSEAIDYQKQLTALNVSEVAKRLKITEDYYRKVTNSDQGYFDYFMDMVPKLAKEYEYFLGSNSVVLETSQARLNELQSKAISQHNGLTAAQAKEQNQLKLLVFVLQDYKKIEEDFSKKGQWDEFIKGIGEMGLTAAEGEKALIRLTTQLTKADKAIRETKVKDLTGSNKLPSFGSFIEAPGLASANPATAETNANLHIGLVNAALEDQQILLANLSKDFSSYFLNIDNGFQGMVDNVIKGIEQLVTKLVAEAAILAILTVITGGTVNGATFAPLFNGIPSFGGNATGGASSVLPAGGIQLEAVVKGSDIYLSNKRYTNMLSMNT